VSSYRAGRAFGVRKHACALSCGSLLPREMANSRGSMRKFADVIAKYCALRHRSRES
jgi:hypothetical protein